MPKSKLRITSQSVGRFRKTVRRYLIGLLAHGMDFLDNCVAGEKKSPYSRGWNWCWASLGEHCASLGKRPQRRSAELTPPFEASCLLSLRDQKRLTPRLHKQFHRGLLQRYFSAVKLCANPVTLQARVPEQHSGAICSLPFGIHLPMKAIIIHRCESKSSKE